MAQYLGGHGVQVVAGSNPACPTKIPPPSTEHEFAKSLSRLRNTGRSKSGVRAPLGSRISALFGGSASSRRSLNYAVNRHRHATSSTLKASARK